MTVVQADGQTSANGSLLRHVVDVSSNRRRNVDVVKGNFSSKQIPKTLENQSLSSQCRIAKCGALQKKSRVNLCLCVHVIWGPLYEALTPVGMWRNSVADAQEPLLI